MKKISIVNSPIDMVLTAAEQVFPSVEAVVQYDETLQDRGSSWAVADGEDGGTIIVLNPFISVMEAAGALAEAITSCYFGTDVSLDDAEFQKSLAEIASAYDNINNCAAVSI